MAAPQESLVLPTPHSFPAFPFDTPYSIQVDLMRHLYSAIERRQIAIAESPTGTGKTLSLLSATLSWLDDDKYRARKGQLDALTNGDSPEWVISQTRDRLRRELEADEREYEEHLAAARKREEAQRRKFFARNVKRQKPTNEESASDDEDQFLPDDGEELDGSVLNETWRKPNYTSSIDPHNDRPSCTKIFYASRTHSQLSQVVPELRKLRREVHHNLVLSPPSHPSTQIPTKDEARKRKHELGDFDADSFSGRSETRFVSLGSRRQLCLNEKLKAKGGDLDERCRELLQVGGDGRCPYLPRPDVTDDNRLHEFRDQILASPKDIEELIVSGQASQTCPYFASREAISQAEVVTLPYNLLLHRDARDALGIDLTNQIVVVDEAHNLITSLLSLSTVTLPLHTLELCLEQLTAYISRFKNRLSSKHVLHLKRLYRLLHTLRGLCSNWQQQGTTEVMTVDDLLSKLGGKLEEINFLEIQGYLRKSKLARKITTYTRKAKLKAEQKGVASYSELGTPPLYAVQEFIAALAAATDDGRLIFTQKPPHNQGPTEMQIKYQSLNPAPQFRTVVDAARSVILAGGTMSPMSDLTAQLFSHLPVEKLSLFSCNHITPESNLRTLVVSRGPRGGELNFKHSNIENADLLFELGQTVANFSRIVPDGMIVFLPSFKVLEKVKNLWEEKGIMGSILKKKKVFTETSADVHELLSQYAEEIRSSGKGALLLAVVGAKLSEGLNFSDGLARMVIVVGLPFPNLGSAELQERLKHADRVANAVAPKSSMYGVAGKELYENMCMNSVNQSIGRAIRHKNDWSMLVLVDMRYQSEKIHNKLPRWIGKSLIITQSFGQAVKTASQFFAGRR